MTRSLIAILIVAALVAMASMAAGAVLAHDDEEVGGNKIVVGFLYEPAYEGERNAVSIRVTKGAAGGDEESGSAAATSEEDHHEPSTVGIEGLQNTLLVEVTHVPSNVSKTMKLRSAFAAPGHYVADLIPTSPGHYRFRFFGTIEGEQVDLTFDSMAGGGDFDDVQPATAIHFPEEVVSARELESAMRGIQTTVGGMQATVAGMQTESDDTHDVDEGRDRAATMMALIGVVLGASGIALGAVSLVLVIRGRKS